MHPPIFTAAKNSVAVTALLGSNPRLYLFGEATQATAKPYAVWQTVYGNPYNFLAGLPKDDAYGVQVDVYGTTAAQCRAVAQALRDAFEPQAYVTAYNGEFKETETNLYRYSFTVEWNIGR